MAKTIESQTALPHSPLPAPASTAPARRPAATTTRRRLPPTVRHLLFDTAAVSPSRRPDPGRSARRVALAVALPLLRLGWDKDDVLDVLTDAWPGRSMRGLAIALGQMSPSEREVYVGDVVTTARNILDADPAGIRRRQARLWSAAASGPWSGRHGGTDRIVYLAIVGDCWAHSSATVRVPVGEIAELTGCSDPGVRRAIRRLRADRRLELVAASPGGMVPNRYRPLPLPVPLSWAVERGDHPASPVRGSPIGGTCGHTVTGHGVEALTAGRADGTSAPARPVVEPSDPALGHPTHAGWHPAALGADLHHLACVLAAADGPLSLRRLAATTGRNRSTVPAIVARAGEIGIAVRAERGVEAGPLLRDGRALVAALDRVATESGTASRAAKRRAARLARAAARRAAWEATHGAEEARQGGAAVGSNGSTAGGGTGPAGWIGEDAPLPRRGAVDGVSGLTPPKGGRER